MIKIILNNITIKIINPNTIIQTHMKHEKIKNMGRN